MSVPAADMAEGYPVISVAERFVRARQQGSSLPDFPGPVPADLTTGYKVQDHAIGLWPDAVAGWKVGRIPPEHEERLAMHRLCGPVFAKSVWTNTPGEVTEFPVFVGGFAAVEAEFVVRVARDAPADKLAWTTEEAAEMIGAMHIGMEPASSPLATINILGPTVVVSDFGNNAGLIVGPEIADWRTRALEDLVCETLIEGEVLGRGGAFTLPGGPIESLRFLLENTARRGRPLKAGMLICTGAAAGIHDVVAGQDAAVRFGAYGEILCRAVAAQASEPN